MRILKRTNLKKSKLERLEIDWNSKVLKKLVPLV